MPLSQIILDNDQVARVRFRRDDEYDSGVTDKRWWDAVKRSIKHRQFAAWINSIRNYHDTVTLPKRVAVELLRFCESLPGWEDGPHYAKRPLLIDVIYVDGEWDSIEALCNPD